MYFNYQVRENVYYLLRFAVLDTCKVGLVLLDSCIQQVYAVGLVGCVAQW